MQPISDPSNFKTLREVPLGHTLIDAQGRKGIKGNQDGIGSDKCRVYFENIEGAVEMDWDETVEVIYDEVLYSVGLGPL